MPRMGSGWFAAAVAIGGALAGFFGYHFWQTLGPAGMDPPGPQLRADARVRSNAANAPAPPALTVPDQLPAITLPDLSGQPRMLRSFLGHPLIVNFWATWCAPCRREMPLLQQLRRQYQKNGVEIVGIAVDFSSAVRDYVARTPISYPILIGEDQGMLAAEKFGMQPVLPFSAFVQPDGRLLTIKVGELHQDEADAILQVQQTVIAGKIDLAQARARLDAQLQMLAIQHARAAGGH